VTSNGLNIVVEPNEFVVEGEISAVWTWKLTDNDGVLLDGGTGFASEEDARRRALYVARCWPDVSALTK
jgi:hypothetical protein